MSNYAITDFVKGLFPGLKKDTIQEDLRISIENLDKLVIPSLDKITTLVKSKFKSEAAKDIEEAFNRSYKGKISKQPNMLLTVKLCLPAIRQNADFIYEEIEKTLEATVIPEGLTSRKAVLVRAAKQISFISDFTMDLLNIVMILETLAQNGELSEDMEVSKGTRVRVERLIVRYGYAITDFSLEPEKFQKKYKDMLDVYVAGSSAKNLSMAGREHEVDPFESRLVQGVAYNPLYHTRIAIANWQANRYHANKEKKKILELRVLQLKGEMERKSDPKIVNEINYTQSRIDKLDVNIREAEEAVGM